MTAARRLAGLTATLAALATACGGTPDPAALRQLACVVPIEQGICVPAALEDLLETGCRLSVGLKEEPRAYGVTWRRAAPLAGADGGPAPLPSPCGSAGLALAFDQLGGSSRALICNLPDGQRCPEVRGREAPYVCERVPEGPAVELGPARSAPRLASDGEQVAAVWPAPASAGDAGAEVQLAGALLDAELATVLPPSPLTDCAVSGPIARPWLTGGRARALGVATCPDEPGDGNLQLVEIAGTPKVTTVCGDLSGRISGLETATSRTGETRVAISIGCDGEARSGPLCRPGGVVVVPTDELAAMPGEPCDANRLPLAFPPAREDVPWVDARLMPHLPGTPGTTLASTGSVVAVLHATDVVSGRVRVDVNRALGRTTMVESYDVLAVVARAFEDGLDLMAYRPSMAVGPLNLGIAWGAPGYGLTVWSGNFARVPPVSRENLLVSPSGFSEPATSPDRWPYHLSTAVLPLRGQDNEVAVCYVSVRGEPTLGGLDSSAVPLSDPDPVRPIPCAVAPVALEDPAAPSRDTAAVLYHDGLTFRLAHHREATTVTVHRPLAPEAGIDPGVHPRPVDVQLVARRDDYVALLADDDGLYTAYRLESVPRECQAGEPCPGGLVCQEGRCPASCDPAQAGACQADLVCVNDVVVAPAVPKGACAAGPCAADGDCPGFHYCAFGRCERNCVRNEDCLEGARCFLQSLSCSRPEPPVRRSVRATPIHQLAPGDYQPDVRPQLGVELVDTHFVLKTNTVESIDPHAYLTYLEPGARRLVRISLGPGTSRDEVDLPVAGVDQATLSATGDHFLLSFSGQYRNSGTSSGTGEPRRSAWVQLAAKGAVERTVPRDRIGARSPALLPVGEGDWLLAASPSDDFLSIDGAQVSRLPGSTLERAAVTLFAEGRTVSSVALAASVGRSDLAVLAFTRSEDLAASSEVFLLPFEPGAAGQLPTGLLDAAAPIDLGAATRGAVSVHALDEGVVGVTSCLDTPERRRVLQPFDHLGQPLGPPLDLGAQHDGLGLPECPPATLTRHGDIWLSSSLRNGQARIDAYRCGPP